MTKKQCFTSLFLFGMLSLANAPQLTAENIDTRTLSVTMKVADFKSIDVSHGIKVNYTNGKNALKVTGSAYILDYFKAYVKKGELNLEISDDFFKKHKNLNNDIVVTLSSPELTGVEASSGAAVNVLSPIKINKKFSVDASSAASVNVNSVTAYELDVELSSGATCSVSSTTAEKVNTEASSGAALNLLMVKANFIDCDFSSGAATNFTNVTAEQITLDCSGGNASSINGKCNTLTIDVSGGCVLNLSKLMAKKAIIDASGGSIVQYNAESSQIDSDISSNVKNFN